jgi:predicted secreted protein
MFRVVARGFSQEFERWTDALNQAKSLMPECKSLTQDVRIYLCDELVWLYSREYKYPQYIGPGSYNLLAKLFLQEALEEEAQAQADLANQEVGSSDETG